MVAAAAVVVAACGGSGSTSGRASSSVSPTLTLGQEYPAMKAAARAATSVAVYGAVLVKGRRGSLDMILTRAGSLSGWVGEGGSRVTRPVARGQPSIKINKGFSPRAPLPRAPPPPPVPHSPG